MNVPAVWNRRQNSRQHRVQWLTGFWRVFILSSICLLSGPLYAGYGSVHGSLLTFVTQEFPPLNYSVNGRVTGASTELIREIMKTMGKPVAFKSYPAKKAELMISIGQAAGFYSYKQHPSLLYSAYFSNPISSTKNVLFKRREREIDWHELEDLRGLKIGASAGHYYDRSFIARARNDLDVNYVYTGSPNLENLRKLARGFSDVFICEYSACGFLIHSYAPEFNMIDFIPRSVGPERSFHVGFSKLWPDAETLRDQFNEILDQKLVDGSVRRIYDKYDLDVNWSILGSQGAYLLEDGNGVVPPASAQAF